jgi:spermidine synthase
VRVLESDRVPQAALRVADGDSTLPYNRTAPAVLLLNPEIRRALMIGLGGGTVARYLQARLRDLQVRYVDVDPAVPEVARRFFRFQVGPRTAVTVADGRRFLHGSAETWDLIYADAYIGQSVPFHLTTVEFLGEVERHLAPRGVFALNLAAGLADPFSQAMYRTVRDRFGAVYVFSVRRALNVLIVAVRETETASTAELLRRGRELDRRLRFEPRLAELASWRSEVALDMAEIPVLTDGYAPVDRLIRLGERARMPEASR